MNIYSFQLLIIFICYLNALVFTGISCFSFFVCLDDRIILNCNYTIYSFIRVFAGTHVDQYYLVARRNRNFQYQALYKMQTLCSWAVNIIHYITQQPGFQSRYYQYFYLLLCGDVELNPKPTKKRNSWSSFSICHWNLNNLTAHNFQEVNLLEVYSTVNQLDVICLSESFLDSLILTENNNLKVNEYKMVRADHPNNVKRGVCAYVRESLPVRNFSNSYLSECLTHKVIISNKKGCVQISQSNI